MSKSHLIALSVLSVLLLTSSFSAHATDEDISEEDLSSSASDEFQHKKLNMWTAVPLSYFVGFGIGQAIQGQYSKYGWAFTLLTSRASVS